MTAVQISGGYFTVCEDYELVESGGTVQRTKPIEINTRYESRFMFNSLNKLSKDTERTQL